MPAECYEDEILQWKDRCRVLEEALARERKKNFGTKRVVERTPALPQELQQEFRPRPKQLQLPISRKGWHRSSEYARTEHCEREKAFADEWEVENQEIPGLNSGMGIMQHLTDVLDGSMTARDACVAASAIQWIGTNCGMCFLGKVIRRSPGVRDSVEADARRGDSAKRDADLKAWMKEHSWLVAQAIKEDENLYQEMRHVVDERQLLEVDKRTAARRRSMLRRT